MPKAVETEFEEVLACFADSVRSAEHLCVYIDFPFCRSNCLYCIYHSLPYQTLLQHREEYVRAVLEQLDAFGAILSETPVESVYFGGGTPSLWSEQELLQIVGRIPNYSQIRSVKSEMHPFDLTDERISFYADKLHLKVASLGVQSLNADACRGQRRLYVDESRLKHIVEEFRRHGIFVNIDLVALFNGDTEEDWQIFEQDIRTVTENIQPDVITAVPNYRTKLDYLAQIPRFRRILADACGGIYGPASRKMLSLDEAEIRKYGKNDHWIGTKKYFRYTRKNFRYCCSAPNGSGANGQTTVAIGGAGKHFVYSYTADGRTFYSAYDFDRQKIVYYRFE